MMEKNVMIPLSLLERIIELLDGLDASRYGYNFQYEYGDILCALKVKMQKIELRDAYAKIITAVTEDTRDLARIEYLRLKNQLGDVDVDVIF